MMNDFEKLKNKLAVLNPEITEKELNEMTKRLIEFFTIGTKAVYEAKKAQTNLDTPMTTGTEQLPCKPENQ